LAIFEFGGGAIKNFKMKKLISISTFLFQIFATFIFLIILFMLYSILDNVDADLVNMTVLLFINPLWGILFSFLTIVVCGLIGLPIRYKVNLHDWWLKHSYIPLIGFMLGVSLLIIAFHGDLTQDITTTIGDESFKRQGPNTTLTIIGWFICAFSILHCYPFVIINSIVKIFAKKH
jgi:hypothetical protein